LVALELVSMSVPAAVPLLSQSWVPWVPSLPAKKSSPFIATGVELTVAPKLRAVRIGDAVPDRTLMVVVAPAAV
jgi:hypothetical protein